MKRLIPILAAVILAVVPAYSADNPISIGNGRYTWDLVDSTNVAATTTYYPETAGFKISPRDYLSVFMKTSGRVVTTIEVNYGVQTFVATAATAADTVIKVDSVAGFIVGQTIRVFDETAILTAVDTAGNLLTISSGLSSGKAKGVLVINSDTWTDITQAGYDSSNYLYGVTGFVDSTVSVDFDDINAMRVRIKSLTRDAGNTVNYRIFYR